MRGAGLSGPEVLRKARVSLAPRGAGFRRLRSAVGRDGLAAKAEPRREAGLHIQ